MSRAYNVAIAGATGAVGADMISTLERRGFPINELRLLASSRSVGKTLTFNGEKIAVQELKDTSFDGIDIALFSAGADRSKTFAPAAVKAGAVVIDNSSAFRYDPDVPLVVPEVNAEAIKDHKGIIANPNCSTIIMLVPVYPLHRAKGLTRVIASTYQAASGAGAAAMRELEEQTREILDGKTPTVKEFAKRIAFNLFPHIDKFMDEGYTKEELKMLWESQKIMGMPELKLSCTCARVPVLRAHSESLTLEFENEITPDEAREILAAAPGVTVVDNPEALEYPMPIDVSGKDNVSVGRIRRDISRDDNRGLNIFVCGDQLLKGAALNAVQIAEEFIKLS